MKRFLATAAAICGASALAPSALAQTAADWTGLYVGGGVGYSSLSDDDETLQFDTNRDGTFNDTVRTGAGADAFSPGFCSGAAMGRTPAEGCRTTDDNVNFSIRAGYDWQWNNWVFGAVGEYSVVNIGNDATGFSTTPASYTFTRDLNSVTALRGRAGYAFDKSLVYATGGWAWADMDHSFTTTNTANSFTRTGGDDVDGYQLGIGYEMQLDSGWMGPGWAFGVEYLWTSLDDGDYQVAIGPGTAPATNPFLIVNSQGTDTRRSNDKFEYGSIGVTMTWRQ